MAQQDGANAPATAMPLVLTGIIAGNDPQNGLAILGPNAQSAKVYAVGDMIAGGPKLHSVYSDRVVIDRDGQLESLALPHQMSATAPLPSSAQFQSAENPVERMRRMISEQPGLIGDVIRPQPVMDHGHLNGFRVYPGRNRAAFNTLGLHAGDQVTAINGTPLDDRDRSEQILRTLSSASEARVTVIRGGQQQDLLLNLAQVAQEADSVAAQAQAAPGGAPAGAMPLGGNGSGPASGPVGGPPPGGGPTAGGCAAGSGAADERGQHGPVDEPTRLAGGILRMTGLRSFIVRTLAVLLAASLASAQQVQRITPNFKDADITQIAEAVSAATGKNFIIDPRVRAQVTMLSSTPMSPAAFYEAFLSILQVYGFIAVPSGNIVKILPDANARQFPSNDLPDHVSATSDEMVTQVMEVHNVSAAQLIPILRPMIAQYGHLAAYPASNILIISDHASNVNRIMRIIQRIDQTSGQDPEIVRAAECGRRPRSCAW